MVYGITPIHVIGLGVAIALFYQSFRLVRKQKESVFEFLLWVGFGSAIFVLSLGQLLTIAELLAVLEALLRLLGFQSGTNGIFTLAILGLLLLLFYTYINAKTNRQKIADLNQELSLLKYQLEQTRHDSAEERSETPETGDD